jgi:3-phytase
MKLLNVLPLIALAFLGCSQNENESESNAIDTFATTTAVKTAIVEDVYQTPRDTVNNVDTPAIWHGPDDQHWLLATAKETDVILVYDATNGYQLDVISESGSGIGQLDRPNSITVVDDFAIVVERNNHRVQVFSLPSFESLGFFGENNLRWPYGVTVLKQDDGGYRLFVTDNYESDDEGVPPDSELGERVHEFTIIETNDSIVSEHIKAFGATAGEGVLKKVESLMADEAYNRLLIADEDSVQNNIKVYDLDGSFTGEIMGEGTFKYEPEGIALYSCGENTGYWVTTDQGKADNFFYVFDRQSLEHIATFSNPNTLNTDGIVISQQSFPGFPDGGFFPIHNDGNVSAVSWGEIANKLNLDICML